MPQLNENELEILRVLWDESPQKAGQIQETFGWTIDNGTLRSALVAMVERGLLRRERRGKAFVYWPRVRRETLFRRMVKRLADVFAGGSTGHLLIELAAKENLSIEDLQKLSRIANDARK